MTMIPGEAWTARSKLREALEEAVASYSSKAPAAAAAPSDAPPADGARQARAVDEPASEGDGRGARPDTASAGPDRYLDQLRRIKAEFDNYRRRVRRDSEAAALRAGEGVIESLLPVLDNLQRALEAPACHEDGRVVEGIEAVTAQLRSILAGHGLEEVPAAPGLPFDPTVHEAILAQESARYAEGAISAVLEPGYLLHGRLLRPARVIVAS